MIEPELRRAFLDLSVRAQQQGLSLVELLDKYQMLNTLDAQRKVQLDTVDYLILRMEQMQATTFGTLGGQQTVAGAVRGCLEYLKMYRKTVEKA